MTGRAPVSDHAALRAALSHMRITSPDGIPFEEALARENGWSPAFAERVADEYCGFLYLAATAGFEVTPSQTVDRAWHLHLSWPHYRDILCDRIVGRPIEHRPGTGEPEDEARCLRQYEETLALYQRVFGKPAPADIWPRPLSLDEEEQEWVSRQRSGRRKLVLVAAATVLAAASTTQVSPLWNVVIACLVAGVLLAVLLPMLGPSRRKPKAAPCGAGCGRGSGSDGDCGSSCGGGCGGGCGGD